jgi:hypothetical protein
VNQEQYYKELTTLINYSANTLDAETLAHGLIVHLAHILALAAAQTGTSGEEIVEVTRMNLDLAFTEYREAYRNAANTTT